MVGQLRRNRYILFHCSSGKVIGVILLLCHNLILKCQQNLGESLEKMKSHATLYLTLILYLMAVSLVTTVESEPEISVVCVGDIMLAGNAAPVIERKGIDYPFDGTRHITQAADVAIGNLEMPIATGGEPVPDKTYTFRGHPRLAKGIANAGLDVLSLANNHTGDYGDEAVLETLKILTQNGLKYAGAGADLKATRNPAVVEVKGVQIAVLAYANTFPFEFFAGESDPGQSVEPLNFSFPTLRRRRNGRIS